MNFAELATILGLREKSVRQFFWREKWSIRSPADIQKFLRTRFSDKKTYPKRPGQTAKHLKKWQFRKSAEPSALEKAQNEITELRKNLVAKRFEVAELRKIQQEKSESPNTYLTCSELRKVESPTNESTKKLRWAEIRRAKLRAEKMKSAEIPLNEAPAEPAVIPAKAGNQIVDENKPNEKLPTADCELPTAEPAVIPAKAGNQITGENEPAEKLPTANCELPTAEPVVIPAKAGNQIVEDPTAEIPLNKAPAEPAVIPAKAGNQIVDKNEPNGKLPTADCELPTAEPAVIPAKAGNQITGENEPAEKLPTADCELPTPPKPAIETKSPPKKLRWSEIRRAKLRAEKMKNAKNLGQKVAPKITKKIQQKNPESPNTYLTYPELRNIAPKKNAESAVDKVLAKTGQRTQDKVRAVPVKVVIPESERRGQKFLSPTAPKNLFWQNLRTEIRGEIAELWNAENPETEIFATIPTENIEPAVAKIISEPPPVVIPTKAGNQIVDENKPNGKLPTADCELSTPPPVIPTKAGNQIVEDPTAEIPLNEAPAESAVIPAKAGNQITGENEPAEKLPTADCELSTPPPVIPTKAGNQITGENEPAGKLPTADCELPAPPPVVIPAKAGNQITGENEPVIPSSEPVIPPPEPVIPQPEPATPPELPTANCELSTPPEPAAAAEN